MEREDVLDAIRRCAADNGGVPVGKARFASLTGIPDSEWLGKYWVRWNDAVVEAGLRPNSFSKDLFADEHLLEQVALLVRDLGRFPIETELRMRHHQDATFPSLKTLRRLGNRRSRLAKLVAYCSEDSTFADVAEICAPLMADASDSAVPNDDAGVSSEVVGYVYLVKSGKHYKIGRSNSAGRRFYEIALQLPDQLTVVHHIETDDPVGIEHYWHQRFKDRRANGEWFALTARDVAAFKRRRRFM